MSTTLIDKKYRDGVPNCVSLIAIQDHSADEATQIAGKTKKKRSSKKMKPGKNGLYPTEDSLIRRWWTSHDEDDESGAPSSSREEITKNRISQLRIRETQLQMIVLLEVLALQPLASASEDLGEDLPSVLPSGGPTEGKEKAMKTKKLDHLAMLIDVHIDRLCIWQSIALDAVKTPVDDSQNAPESVPKHADNLLRDFCVDIIGPL
jgi:DNA replication regulator SLD3